MLEFTDVFLQSPGDFFFHAFVIFALSITLMVATAQRARHPESRTAVVYGGAAASSLAIWFLIVLGAIYSVYTGQDQVVVLPPLERAASILLMLIIAWAFLVADPLDHHDWGNTPLLVLLGLVALTTVWYVLTSIQWSAIAYSVDFNLSQMGVFWTFAQAGVGLVGLVLFLVFFERVIDAPLKILFFAILAVAHSLTLWQMANGSIIGGYSGISRMALFLAIPIVPYVVYRKVLTGYERALQLKEKSSTVRSVADLQSSGITQQPLSEVSVTPSSSPVERESVQLLRTLGLIMEGSSPSEIPLRIVKSAMDVLKADVGALLSVKDVNYADILIAYDRAMQRPIPAMLSLNLDEQVTLLNAIERKQQRPLFTDRNIEELEDLYSRLDVPQIGPTYFQPLMHDSELVAMLVIGLPYAKRELRDAERELLKGIGIISGNLLSLSYAAEDAMTRAEERVIQAMASGVPIDEVTDINVLEAQREMQAALDAAKGQNESLQRQVAQLKLALDDERTRLTHLLGDTEQGLSITQRIVALNDEQDQLRNERDLLAHRLQEAETALASATGMEQDSVFTTQIETLRREKTSLEQEMVALREQLSQLQQVDVYTKPEDIIDRMNRERERLQAGRDELDARLQDVSTQLQALGLEGGADDLTQLVQQLYNKQARLQAKSEQLKLERDILWTERRRFEQRIRKEEEREMQIETMESEIRHLATDREAISRQRDSLRQERDQYHAKMDKLKEQRARLLADISVYQDDIQQADESLNQLQAKLDEISLENQKFESQVDELLTENRMLRSERDQLLARIEGNRERIEQISAEADSELREMLREITNQRNELAHQLRDARQALQHADNIMTKPTEPASAMVSYTANGATNPELLMSMVDSLRTPMTAMVGYIDLMVNESAGLLSEMQRKFIQRISANTVRLQTMLNDLTHITALDTGTYQLNLERTNIINLVEDAVTNATYQFREKDLTLTLDLDDTMPDAYVDVDGINQVVGQLLTNAYLVSPPETEVKIQAYFRAPQTDTDYNHVVLAVTDSGGGILDDDRDEVFARRYRTEHHLVQGLGDTGVGLSIAKAVVEAHSGTMSFMTDLEMGKTTFIVAIPANLKPVEFE